MHPEMSVVVNRPIEEVWAYVTDPFNLPRWGGRRLAVRATPPGPLRVGSTVHQRWVVFGVETRLSGVITEWDPPRVVTVSLMDDGIARSGFARTTLEATAAGTKVLRSGGLELRGIWKLLSPIVRPYIRRMMEDQNQNLKRLLESGET
jgi:uncharacterized protein YndB with AHSA1/START domain